MKSLVLLFLSLIAFLLSPSANINTEFPEISIYPAEPIQGQAIVAILRNQGGKNVSFSLGSSSLATIYLNGKAGVIFGFGLEDDSGEYVLSATSSDGLKVVKKIELAPRIKKTESLGIPSKLGGNTAASQKRLVASLADENKTLNSLATEQIQYWSGSFIQPVREVFITDEYGYSRKTGAYTISHKGTDYRANIGDDVMAISDGKVVLAEEFPTYGKSVVVDHGYGLQSLYMHLSEIRVRVGEDVVKGQVIASSGESGYAEFPHLHLSVRINGTSIDPYFFIETMQKFNEEDII